MERSNRFTALQEFLSDGPTTGRKMKTYLRAGNWAETRAVMVLRSDLIGENSSWIGDQALDTNRYTGIPALRTSPCGCEGAMDTVRHWFLHCPKTAQAGKWFCYECHRICHESTLGVAFGEGLEWPRHWGVGDRSTLDEDHWQTCIGSHNRGDTDGTRATIANGAGGGETLLKLLHGGEKCPDPNEHTSDTMQPAPANAQRPDLTRLFLTESRAGNELEPEDDSGLGVHLSNLSDGRLRPIEKAVRRLAAILVLRVLNIRDGYCCN